MTAAERRQIVMTFTGPPSEDDIRAIAEDVMQNLPHELLRFCAELDLSIEDFPNGEVIESLDIENEFDLLALYRAHTEKLPGVISKESCNPILSLYRRPLLDLWCDSQDDLSALVKQVIITEIAQSNGFAEHEVEELCARAA